MQRAHRGLRAAALLATACLAASASEAAQFSFLNPSYQQEIYTGPLVGGPGMAWTSSGNLLTRNFGTLYEYPQLASATYQSTPIHPVIATHNIAGMNSGSTFGMVNGNDGCIYTSTGTWLLRIDPTTGR